MERNHGQTPERPAPEHPGAEADSPVRRGDFWISVLVLIFVVEFFISIVALCYGIVLTPPRGGDETARIAFPWIGWIAAMLLAPALILGLARLFAGKRDAEESRREKAWTGRLPERAARLYRFMRDAPLFMVCLSLLALGATLLAMDSAFSFIQEIFLALVPYAPHFIGGATLFAIAIAALMAWFRYKNNQLLAEYQFRREVLEKTGVILVDGRGKALLPPDGRADGYAVAAIGGGEKETRGAPARLRALAAGTGDGPEQSKAPGMAAGENAAYDVEP
jgi:hypothetical protein